MKKTSLTMAAVVALGAFLAATPASAKQAPRIEAVFVLDTTGSMSGLIHAAKEKIWAIANSLAQAKPTPEIKLGLVAYRDRGDAYITRRTDLTGDLDAIYNDLMAYEADGGGDGPESVNQGLNEAVTQMSWSAGQETYRTIFLVGDFPPHMDYDDDVPYQASCQQAAKKRIVVNTVQCGSHGRTTPIWQEIASLAGGDFFKVKQSGGAVIASTPYDAEIADLSRELDDTRLYYGDRKARRAAKKRISTSRAIHGKASPAAKARRAEFNVSAAGAGNFLGGKELVNDIESGRVKLDGLAAKELPEELRKLGKKEQKKLVEEKIARRKALQKKIKTLSKKRKKHIEKELAKTADKGKGALGQRIYDSVRAQAAEQSIEFESESAAH